MLLTKVFCYKYNAWLELCGCENLHKTHKSYVHDMYFYFAKILYTFNAKSLIVVV